MVFLGQEMGLRRRAVLGIALVLVTVAAGCALLEKLGLFEQRVTFPHQTHSEKEDLSCTDCHAKAEVAEKAGMPVFKQCVLCHKGIDEKKPAEKHIDVIFGEKPEWSRFTALPDDVIFSHKVHTEHKVACADCHRSVGSSAEVTRELVRVTMDDCVRCHARGEPGKPPEKAAAGRPAPGAAGEVAFEPPTSDGRGGNGDAAATDSARADAERRFRDNACSVCHKEIRQDVKPATHFRNWKLFHGQTVRADTGLTANRCALCHTDSSCSKCHQDEPPQNHTEHWRQRGHGIAVSIDRSRCAVCHRTDSCDRCHQDTAPRNHTASWGEPADRHCLTCHFPLRNEGCFTCHKTDPSHKTAPPPPANAQHAAATEAGCRTCHNVIKLPHPDGGDSCRACH